MTSFVMETAGIAVAVHAVFESTRDFCAGYLTDRKPELTVSLEEADICYEREKSAREDRLEGHPVRHYSDAYLETLAVQRRLSEQLLNRDILLFHGSVVAVDGIGYLFTAKSGTGKSTHTRLWRQHFGHRAVMINDDKPFLHISPEGVTAWGSPWMGKHNLGTNTSVPLKAICILQRGQTNSIRHIPPKDTVQMLVQQSSRPRDPGQMVQYLDLVDRLSAGVRFYRLCCNMDPQAAQIAWTGMQD